MVVKDRADLLLRGATRMAGVKVSCRIKCLVCIVKEDFRRFFDFLSARVNGGVHGVFTNYLFSRSTSVEDASIGFVNSAM